MRTYALLACSVLFACISDDSIQPQDGGSDQTSGDSATTDVANDVTNGDGGDSGVVDPTWTVPLPARSALNAVAVDTAGNVYVAGYVEAPLSLAPISIASTQGLDVFIAKFDGKTKAPLWGVSYGGAGDDAASAIAWTPNGLYVTGTTTGTSMQMGSSSIVIPAGTGGVAAHSFFARIDPSDGTVGWALSPDAARVTYQAHSSSCLSIAANGPNFSIACTYSGSYFSWDQSHAAWDSSTNSATAVFHFTDGTYQPVQQWTKSFGYPNGSTLFATVALDAGGDTWVGGTFRGNTATMRDEPTNVQILAGGSYANPFVVKIANGTQAVAPAKSWAADTTNYIPSFITNIAVTPTQVFAVGQYITNGADGNFGKGALTSQGFDMFALGLGVSALDSQWVFAMGGAGLESIRGITVDGTNTYVGIAWGSASLMFGTSTLPDPASTAYASGIGKLDGTGTPVSALSVSSVSASVRVLDLKSNATALYAVGTYGGDTTWDDGTNATGNATDGNGFLMRRKKF